VKALAGLAGGRFGWVYGRPAIATEGDVLVAFGAGTHIFCLRLPREEVGPLAVTRADPPANQPLLRRKQLELETLVAGEWTRVDPWPAETAAALAAALRRSAT
jgi:hypothetical protein